MLITEGSKLPLTVMQRNNHSIKVGGVWKWYCLHWLTLLFFRELYLMVLLNVLPLSLSFLRYFLFVHPTPFYIWKLNNSNIPIFHWLDLLYAPFYTRQIVWYNGWSGVLFVFSIPVKTNFFSFKHVSRQTMLKQIGFWGSSTIYA